MTFSHIPKHMLASLAMGAHSQLTAAQWYQVTGYVDRTLAGLDQVGTIPRDSGQLREQLGGAPQRKLNFVFLNQ